MNYSTDPAFYEHVFYPSFWKPLFLLAIFVGVPMVSFLGLYYGGQAQPFSICFGIVLGSIFFAGIVFTFCFSRKLAIGLNQEGMYTWHVGFIPWKQIRSCQTVRATSSPIPVSITISLHDVDLFLQKAKLGKRKRLLFLLRGKKIRIPAHLISICLPKLIKLLKAYHHEARNKEIVWPMDML